MPSPVVRQELAALLEDRLQMHRSLPNLEKIFQRGTRVIMAQRDTFESMRQVKLASSTRMYGWPKFAKLNSNLSLISLNSRLEMT